MAKATKRLQRARASSKSTKPLLRLSPLGRQLLAAIIDHAAHTWLNPESGHLSEELSGDQRYRRAWSRLADEKWGEVYHVAKDIMAAPLSLSNLADRVLIHHQWCESGDLVADYLPAANRTLHDEDFHRHMPAIAAIIALSDVPHMSPGSIYEEQGPPDAEARVLAMLGKHRPKRKALSSTEEKAIADAAAADAVAKAAAAVTGVPRDAPFFE